MLRDLYHNLKVITVKVAAPTDNTAIVSPIVDTRDYESVAFLIATGTLADADATFTALVEEGEQSNLGDAAAVDDEHLLGTEAGASFNYSNDDATFKIGYKGNERYVRCTVTPAANSGAAPITILAVGVPRVRPAT